MADAVERKYGIRFVVTVRGFASEEARRRKAARKYLKRAKKLGFPSIRIRFENDRDFRDRMREEHKSLDDIEDLDDLARMPVDAIPMSYADRLAAGYTITKVVDEGAQPQVRGQKTWRERQWQEWNEWYQTRHWSWRS